MSHDIKNAGERLRNAVYTMMVGVVSIHERLEEAVIGLVPLRPEDVPDDERADFAAVMDLLTRHPAEGEGEGSIAASIRRLTPDECGDLAKKIWSIYIGVTSDTR